MEQNLPIIAKKFWSIVRVLYFMLRKGISKAKLFADLNSMMKRGKIAGKAAIHNLLMFHHHSAAAGRRVSSPVVPINEYEFSCSSTPAYRLPFHLNKRKRAHAPPPIYGELVAAALEIFSSEAASPALPGFGPSPMVRQLRVTDSPFPLSGIEEDNNHVDEAAEEFIMRFYKDLKKQNCS
ncbi:hypothetical protein DH2020_041174 [Rehmannia glutinosa]|uniref:Avr9/Cf-9 rapidly elicited protein n=1 Tax=Rehmannia glutinosa TaxID=99300 RepID=A0ABR0US33_REHGL